jgi:hypothetical protein
MFATIHRNEKFFLSGQGIIEAQSRRREGHLLGVRCAPLRQRTQAGTGILKWNHHHSFLFPWYFCPFFHESFRHFYRCFVDKTSNYCQNSYRTSQTRLIGVVQIGRLSNVRVARFRTVGQTCVTEYERDRVPCKYTCEDLFL